MQSRSASGVGSFHGYSLSPTSNLQNNLREVESMIILLQNQIRVMHSNLDDMYAKSKQELQDLENVVSCICQVHRNIRLEAPICSNCRLISQLRSSSCWYLTLQNRTVVIFIENVHHLQSDEFIQTFGASACHWDSFSYFHHRLVSKYSFLDIQNRRLNEKNLAMNLISPSFILWRHFCTEDKCLCYEWNSSNQPESCDQNFGHSRRINAITSFPRNL